MMPDWIPAILDNDLFRPFDRLYNDLENDLPGDRPQVIFIEPTYTDAPHIGAGSDDHSSSSLARKGRAGIPPGGLPGNDKDARCLE